MITDILLKKGSGVPSSLKLAEPAIDILNKILYVGLTEGENGGSDFMKIIDEEAVKNIVAETTLNSDLIILGNGEKSIIINDLENKADGKYSFAKGWKTQSLGACSESGGYNTIAGIKGYFFQNIEFGPEIFDENGVSTKTYGPCTITLTKEQPDDIKLAPVPEPFKIGFSDGDELTLINDSKYPRCCKITGVTDNIITVDALPFNTIKNIGENIGYDDYQVICPDKPLAGDLPLGYYAHVEGEGSWALERASHAEGRKTRAEGQYSHAEGRETKAGYASHAEGIKTEAGDHSHAEGVDTKSLGGEGSHSEGKWTKALGNASHAEGKYAQATAETAHAEGLYGIAGARGSHTEGYYNNIAKGADFAHAENYRNEITEAGLYAHAEGEDTVVKAKGAHTEGWNTIASGEYQHVQGKYNKYQDDDGNPLNYADIIGGGFGDGYLRKNIQTTDWYGNFWTSGNIYMGGSEQNEGKEVATKDYVSEKIADIPINEGEGDYTSQTGYGTQAVGHYTSASGYNTIAGIKGYFFQNIEFGPKIFDENGVSTKTYGPCTITLTKEQPDDIKLAPVPEPFKIGFSDGDELTITNNSKYPRCCRITGVTDNIITVDALPFNSIVNKAGDIGVDEYQVICSDKPQCGEVSLGYYAYAEGETTRAIERASHAEGRETVAVGEYSHAEGFKSTVSGYCSHAEGNATKASGHVSHAEGAKCQAIGGYSHAEGYATISSGKYSHAEGSSTEAVGEYSHVEGRETKAGYASHAEGIKTEAGDYSHAEGVDTESFGGEGSHSEGKWTKALGNASHAEGKYAQATAETAHAEGLYGVAGATGSHTEGYYNNIAKGADFAHAENYRNKITEAGLYAHAEGEDTVVKAKGAHTEGWHTIASVEYQHAQGKYNKYQDDDGNPLNYADIVGNGSSEEDRSNAYTLDWEGNAWFAGDITVGKNNSIVLTNNDILTETWSFTLEDGTIINKVVCLK